MSDHFGNQPFPRGLLVGAALLVGLSLVTVAAVRIRGLATASAPADINQSATVIARELRFEDRSDGGVAVFDVQSKKSLDVIPGGSNGFLRATLRGLARDRRSRGIGSEVPFRLSQRADGQVILEDPTTQRRVYLAAFGATNANAFARLLTATER